MGSAKEDLRTTIEALSEAEAARAMEYIRRLRGRVSREHMVKRYYTEVRTPGVEQLFSGASAWMLKFGRD